MEMVCSGSIRLVRIKRISFFQTRGLKAVRGAVHRIADSLNFHFGYSRSVASEKESGGGSFASACVSQVAVGQLI